MGYNIVVSSFVLCIHTVPSTLIPTVILNSNSSKADVGSSVTLICSPSLSDASQYNGANINFQYQHNGDSGAFRFVNKMISGGTVPTDSTELTVDTSSAGTYTCSVTISGLDISFISGSSASGQGSVQITAQSK